MTDRDPVDAMSEAEVRLALSRCVTLMMRLGDVTDDASRVHIVRMLSSQDPADPIPDVPTMVERTLDERDRLRNRIATASERLERLAGQSYTLSILKGEA